MSAKATIWAWAQTVPSSTARLVLLGLADIARDSGKIWAGRQYIASKIQMSERTVRDTLPVLVEAGLLAIESRPGKTDIMWLRLTPVVIYPDGPEPDEETLENGSKTPATGSKTPERVADEPDSKPRNKTNTAQERVGSLFGGDDGAQQVGEWKNPGGDLGVMLFNDWWLIFPRKKAKGAAEKAFAKAILQVDIDTLMARTQTFADLAKGKDPEFLPHPATWLNQKRWDDEDLQPKPSGYTGPVGTDDWR